MTFLFFSFVFINVFYNFVTHTTSNCVVPWLSNIMRIPVFQRTFFTDIICISNSKSKRKFLHQEERLLNNWDHHDSIHWFLGDDTHTDHWRYCEKKAWILATTAFSVPRSITNNWTTTNTFNSFHEYLCSLSGQLFERVTFDHNIFWLNSSIAPWIGNSNGFNLSKPSMCQT